MNWFSYKVIKQLQEEFKMIELSKKTCKELREIAKHYNIKGRWDMTKEQLIEEIENAFDWSDEKEIYEPDKNIIEEGSNQSEGSQKAKRTTLEYLINADKGTLVAFRRNNQKERAMSGKLVSIEGGGKVTIESKKGTLFTLPTECIIWVKTGARWPKWVFSLFNNDKEAQIDNAIS